jgi:hypothetical protein
MENANATPPTVLAPRKSPTYESTEELVTFHIGKGLLKKTFVVHKEVACLYSPVLKAAFNSQFIEGQTQTYTIDDTTKEVFQLLVQWFYGQKFEPFATKAEIDSVSYLSRGLHWGNPVEINLHSRSVQYQTSLIGLWILADKFCIPAIQNLVVDESESMRKVGPTSPISEIAYHSFKYVYEHTLPGDNISDNKLRYLLLMQVLHTSTDFTFRLYKREFTHEMLIDYIVLSKKMDQSSLQDIFSKEELFQSTFHVSKDGLEDARMAEAIEGNELIRGRLRAVMKKLEN